MKKNLSDNNLFIRAIFILLYENKWIYYFNVENIVFLLEDENLFDQLKILRFQFFRLILKSYPKINNNDNNLNILILTQLYFFKLSQISRVIIIHKI